MKNPYVSIITFLVGAAVTASLVVFNRNAVFYNQYIVGNLIGLLWVPMMTILFFFREDPSKFGLAPVGSRRIWLTVGALYAGMLVVMLIVSRWSGFQSYYPLFKQYPEFGGWFATNPGKNPFIDAPMMMLYAEASYGLYLFCWEFFFRGYLLFGMLRSIGWSAILLQAAAFGILHLGKPIAEQIASYAAGIALGIIALRARSMLPCFALHWAVALTFDVLVVFSD